MFKINTFIKLIKYVAGYILIGLGIFAINNLGVAKMMLGENTANALFYPVYYWVIQWTTVVFLVVLFGLIIFPIINYIINRGEPDDPSAELKALIRLDGKLDSLIEIIGGKSNGTTKNE
ncbi:MAG: hypothetical protein PHQ86_00360 [Dehalococcoidales bacterium]|nr:hypothetical protein [Dehalococcoidales bacterium]